MKKTTLLIVSLVFGFIAFAQQDYQAMIAKGIYKVKDIVEVAEQHFDVVGRGRGTGYKPFRRWQYFAERDMDEFGYLKSPQFYYNELQNFNANTLNTGFTSRTTTGAWEAMGPTDWNATSGWNPGVGRITSIAIDPSDSNHIIVGSPTGGVWKTTNGGTNWTVLTDNLSNIDVYALAIAPQSASTYFWGSDNGALYKSTDSGATWSAIGSLTGGRVNKILIHPTDSNKMFCSAQSGGLFKSTDGGQTWSSISFIAPSTGFDFAFKPGDPNTVYASGDSFYVSTNGGTSFVGKSGFSSGPKMIGVSPNDASVVYVLEASGGAFGGFYKSTDSGQNFTKLTHTKNYFGYESDGSDTRGQAPRDMAIAVNPNDVDDVHIAGINTWRSTNGGTSFTITSQWYINNGIGYCHADVDIMQFVGTGANTKLFVGSDGGIFKANNPTNPNINYYTDLTSGLGIRQFYKIGISQTSPVIVTGGSQDNGTSVLRANGTWYDWLGADGMECFVDKNNTQIMYGTSQFGSFYKTLNGGNTRTGVTQPDDKGGTASYNWVVPFEQDPTVANTIYCAFDEVYKSTDGGSNWTSISPNYSANIDHLKIAPSNNQYLYMAINGTFYYSTNGGTNWSTSSLNLNGGNINSIAVHPTDPQKVAIATSNAEKVYISTNGGTSFNSAKWNLPSFSSQAVVWQNNASNGLYVGMNYGVFYTDDALGNTWNTFNNGLPNVRINELEINTAENKIYAATYGRGLWRSNVYDSSFSIDEVAAQDTFVMYPNPAKNSVNLKWNTSEKVNIRVFNTLGKLVYFTKGVSLQNGYNINTNTFEAGIYFVKLNSSYGELTKKLIVK